MGAGKKGWLKPALCKTRGYSHIVNHRYAASTTEYAAPKISSTQVHLILAKLALVVEEVGEAVTEARHGRWGIWYTGAPVTDKLSEIQAGARKPEGFVVELADIVIRVMQLSEALGLPLQEAIELKLTYNHTRPFRHGKKA